MLEKTPRVRGQRVTSLLGPREIRVDVCICIYIYMCRTYIRYILYICVYMEYAHFLWI